MRLSFINTVASNEGCIGVYSVNRFGYNSPQIKFKDRTVCLIFCHGMAAEV